MDKITEEVGLSSAADVVLSVQTAQGSQAVGAAHFKSLPTQMRVKLESAKPANEAARQFML
eukprot:SAG31_NODE_30647_length_378_cov_0.734767_1_plen_60_part_01